MKKLENENNSMIEENGIITNQLKSKLEDISKLNKFRDDLGYKLAFKEVEIDKIKRSTGDSSKSTKDILNKLKDNENSLNEVLKERTKLRLSKMLWRESIKKIMKLSQFKKQDQNKHKLFLMLIENLILK